MFCPNCGANLPEGTAFCGSCGAAQKTQQQAPMQQPAYQAPTQQPVYQAPAQPTYPPAPQQPAYRPAPVAVSKREFLSKHADAATKKNSLIVTITFLLTLALIVASILAPIFGSLYDIPAVSTIIPAMLQEETGDLEN